MSRPLEVIIAEHNAFVAAKKAKRARFGTKTTESRPVETWNKYQRFPEQIRAAQITTARIMGERDD
jgi:hypothetical protein